VSPEALLTATGRTVFETIWRTSAYQTEICEPFATSARLAGFPISRTWTQLSGSLASRLDVRCLSETNRDYEYAFHAADGSVIESGTIRVDATAKPLPAIDVRPSSGRGGKVLVARRGRRVYDDALRS
jgi:hypothetical protein